MSIFTRLFKRKKRINFNDNHDISKRYDEARKLKPVSYTHLGAEVGGDKNPDPVDRSNPSGAGGGGNKV